MSWTCEQTEARLSDYLDGMLNSAELAEFTAHVPSCARCAPLVASVSNLLTGLHGMEQIAEPPRLVYSILDKTLGPREAVTGWRAMLAWVRGAASIRLAYGALSVAATLIIVATASGFSWRERSARGERNSIAFARGQRSARESGEHSSSNVPTEAAWEQRWVEAHDSAAAESRQRFDQAFTNVGDSVAVYLRRARRTVISRSVL